MYKRQAGASLTADQNDLAIVAADLRPVGGDDGEIVLIGREAGSGTRDGFESIVDVKDSCKYAQELTATGAVISAVAVSYTHLDVYKRQSRSSSCSINPALPPQRVVW